MSWWNNSWCYRKKLTFDNSGQAENLTDFPVLVKLDADNFDFSQAQSAGQDIRFVDADGSTELKYEIEHWVANTEAWIWVKVPQIDGSSSTDFIYMYYGNSEASDAQDAANTWDSHYKAVYHLNKSSGVVVDSKGVNNGTNNGATRGQTGKIDNCFSFDEQDDYVNCGNDESLQIKENLTVEAWAKRDVTDAQNTIASKLKFGADAKRCWMLRLGNNADSNKIRFYVSKDGNGSNYLDSDTAISDTTNQHYVVATYEYKTDGTSVIKIYLEGSPDGTKNDVLGDLYAENGEPVRIGCLLNAAGDPFNLFNGLIDEVRISDSVRSADWIAAQNLSMTLAFVTFGGIEIHSSDAGSGAESLGSRLLSGAETGLGVGALALLAELIGTEEAGVGTEFAVKVFSAVDSGLGVDAVVARLLSAIEAGSALEAALLTAGLISGDGGLGSDLSTLLKAILAYDEGSGFDGLRALIETPTTGSDMRLHTSPGQVRIPSKGVNL